MVMTNSPFGLDNVPMIPLLFKPQGRPTMCSTPTWRLSLPALIFALILPLPALAWNGAGHRLIACLAWDHLDPEVRLEAGMLLRKHPDYERWLRKAKDEIADRSAFIEASTWPDEIRKDLRFYTAGIDDPTPILPGFPDMERHSNWHYVNRPLDGSLMHKPRPGQLDKQLVRLTNILGGSVAPSNERTYALPWIIHLVGEAHQPLHTSIRLDAEGKWDPLGNGLFVNNPFSRRKSPSTLHAFWDDLPGPSWLRGDRLNAACRALIALQPRPEPSFTSEQWIEESWQIARNNAYPDSIEAVPTLNESFFENSREIANRRVVMAGYRLADLLNRLLKN